MNNTPNPIFSKFDQALGMTKPTVNSAGLPNKSRADEIRSLASQNSPDNQFLGGTLTDAGTRAKSDFKDAGKNISDMYNGVGEYAGQSSVRRGTGIVAEATSAPIKALSEAIPEPVKEGIGKATSATVKWLGDNPASRAMGFNSALQNLTEKYPEAAHLLEDASGSVKNIGDTAGSILTVEGGKGIGSSANKLSEAGTTAVSNAKNAVLPAARGAEDLLGSAVKDATPAYNKNLINEPHVKGSDGSLTPRVQEGKGVLAQRTVTTSPIEREAGAELAKVPGYDPKGTNLEKYNSIQPELKARGKALEQSLKSENILRPPKEISKLVKDAVNNTSEESLLLQKSDPAIKQYMRVLNNAITANDGTLAGELKVRQALDAAYKNARGKMAFGDGKISTLDEIHTSARDALNRDLIENAVSTDVKASLRSQWNLNRAADVLRDKAEVEGNSSIERIMKSHPVASKIVKGAAKLTGLGSAVHLVP